MVVLYLNINLLGICFGNGNKFLVRYFNKYLVCERFFCIFLLSSKVNLLSFLFLVLYLVKNRSVCLF